MSINIDVFSKLEIAQVKNFCKEFAKENEYRIYEYFYNNDTHINDFVGAKFAGNVNIYNFAFLAPYKDRKADILFSISDEKRILREGGIENYIRNHGELVFHLALKGFRFLYKCKFYKKPIVSNINHDDYTDETDSDELNLLLADEFLSESSKALLINLF